jgi:hypothetical protein
VLDPDHFLIFLSFLFPFSGGVAVEARRSGRREEGILAKDEGSEIGLEPSGIGLEASSFGEEPSGIGLMASSFGEEPSGIGLEASSFGEKPSGIGLMASSFGEEPSGIGLVASPLAPETAPLTIGPLAVPPTLLIF